jgi:transcriptional regulator with XRE-family HTH domain
MIVNNVYIAMNYNKIHNICKKNKMTISKLCQEIEITEAGYYGMIRNNSMRIDILEKICEVLNVSISVFFNEGETLQQAHEPATLYGQKNKDLETENKHLLHELHITQKKLIKCLEQKK